MNKKGKKMGRTYTSNFNLIKRDEGDIDWADDVNGNMDTIDEKIADPESHTHTSLVLDSLKLSQANEQFGVVSLANITLANADATYGTDERDLINELKSKLNELMAALRTSTGCGVLRFETTTTTSSTSSSSTTSTSTSSTTTTV